jgi:hypothetical protein
MDAPEVEAFLTYLAVGQYVTGSSHQLGQQCLRLLEISRVEALGKPGIDGCQ